jgi:hypothetical protein
VGFVVDKVALGKLFLSVLPFPPVSIIPPVLHTHLHLQVALTRRTNGPSLGTLKSNAVLEIRKDWIQNTFTFLGGF